MLFIFPPLQLGQAHYFVKLLQELVLSRQEVLQRALFAGSLENMWKGGMVGGQKKRLFPLEEEEDMSWQKRKKPNVEQQYNRQDRGKKGWMEGVFILSVSVGCVSILEPKQVHSVFELCNSVQSVFNYRQ